MLQTYEWYPFEGEDERMLERASSGLDEEASLHHFTSEG